MCLHCGFKNEVRENMCETSIYLLLLKGWLLPKTARTVGPWEKKEVLPYFSQMVLPTPAIEDNHSHDKKIIK